MKKILALSGSTRTHSSNIQLLNYIATSFHDQLTIEIDHSLPGLPFFVPDVNEIPAQVIQYLNRIKEADGVLICTPEYVFSIPGMLKNALEWTVGSASFSGKPVALITASSLGEKAHESLMLIMKTLEAEFSEETTLLIKGVRGKITKEGEVSDEETKIRIQKIMNVFIERLNFKA